MKGLENYMVKSPYVGEPSMAIREAVELMRECDIRHLPVVDTDRLVGIVSEGDLKEAAALPQAESLRLVDVMKRSVYVVTKTTSLREVVEHMADLKYGSAVVVNSQREVIGIFTTIDALRILADLLEDEGDNQILSFEDYFERWITAGSHYA